MAKIPKIFVDVHTVTPYHTATGSPGPGKQLWSPTNVTLIHTVNAAIICDCPPTIAETEKLAEWVKQTIPGKEVLYFLATHAHADHFFGVPVLAKHFPGVKAIAPKSVAKHATTQYEGQWVETWSAWFPDGQLPAERVADLPVNNRVSTELFDCLKLGKQLNYVVCRSNSTT